MTKYEVTLEVESGTAEQAAAEIRNALWRGDCYQATVVGTKRIG